MGVSDEPRVGDEPTGALGPWNAVTLDLRRLRAAAGAPSYAEIVRRIEGRRAARGLPPTECRVARTTVYDAFRSGRTRLDAALVCEIVDVLGGDVEAARASLRSASLRDADRVVPEVVPTPGLVEPSVGRIVSMPLDPAREGMGRRRRRAALALVVCCVVVNLLGRVLVDAMQVPLYLDMVGTAVAAVLLGPWRAVVVGLSTNVLGVAVSGPESLPFAAVNVAGALVWGYGVWRFGAARSVSRFFSLNVVVALVCSVVAVPIIVAMDGVTGNGADSVTAVVRASTAHLALAVTSSNIVTSVGDKLISGFLALLVLDTVAARRFARGRSRSPGTTSDD